MANKNNGISLWYILIILLFVTIAVRLFIDFTEVNKEQNLTKVQEEIAAPIPDSFNEDAVENLKRRIVITDEEIDAIKLYSNVNLSPDTNSRKESTRSATIKNVRADN